MVPGAFNYGGMEKYQSRRARVSDDTGIDSYISFEGVTERNTALLYRCELIRFLKDKYGYLSCTGYTDTNSSSSEQESAVSRVNQYSRKVIALAGACSHCP